MPTQGRWCGGGSKSLIYSMILAVIYSWKWVEAPFTPAFQQSFRRDLVLDKKNDKDDIGDRHCYLWWSDEHVQDFCELWEQKELYSNGSSVMEYENLYDQCDLYAYLCTVGSMNLLMATILLLHRELIKLTGDVVRSTYVRIPVGIDTIRWGHHVCHLVTGEVPVKTLLVALHNVAKLATE
jgi:hypothetical protein